MIDLARHLPAHALIALAMIGTPQWWVQIWHEPMSVYQPGECFRLPPVCVRANGALGICSGYFVPAYSEISGLRNSRCTNCIKP